MDIAGTPPPPLRRYDECDGRGGDEGCCGHYATTGACDAAFTRGKWEGYCRRTCGACGGSWRDFALGPAPDTHGADVDKNTILARIALLTYVVAIMCTIVIAPFFWCSCRKRFVRGARSSRETRARASAKTRGRRLGTGRRWTSGGASGAACPTSTPTRT